MQLIANGTQGPTSIPTKQTPIGTPGFGFSNVPGVVGTQTIVDADVFNTVLAELANVVTASGQSLSASNNSQVAAAIPILATGRLIAIQQFNSAGTSTYTPSAGTNKIRVTVTGGGGGSAGSNATGGTQVSLGSGGGGGATGISFLTSGFSGATVTVGAGGTAGAAGGNGGAGGTSSFGAFISAPGGPGGMAAPATAPITVAPGVNGAATATGGNLLNSPGGGPSLVVAVSVGSTWPSIGGASHWGFAPAATGNATIAGVAGVAPGVGANGAVSLASSAAQVGAAGAPGRVVIEEYA